jgi:hypothetical protein
MKTFSSFRILILTVIAVSTLGLHSCKKADLKIYTDSSRAYFATDSLINGQKDSLTYSFAIKPDSRMKDTVYIPLRVLGMPALTSRTVKVVATGGTAIAGTHYNIISPKIRAGRVKDSVMIEILKTPDLKTQIVSLQLQIVDGGDLPPGIIELTKYKLKINNILTKPDNWNGIVGYFFGTYSQVKHRFIIEVTGYASYYLYLPGTTTYDSSLFMFLQQKLRQEILIRGPIIDEFGNPISF